MSEKITPEIRFKWFTDDWEPRKLGEIAEIIGGGTPSTNNPTYWDGDIDWYAPAEIGEQIFAKGSVRKITKEGLSHCSARILPAYKTVLFTSRAGIGNMAILQHPAATNQGFQSLVCHNDIEPYFVFSMGNNIKAAAECVATGSTFDEISGKKLSKLEFMFPDIAEQQVIGACFKNIDMLITIHKHKLTKLQLLKKSMLTKMFPKDGARVPEIRFQGFHNDWEHRKILDEAEIITGGTPSTKVPEYWNQPEIPWLSSGEVHKKYITATDALISRLGFENSSAQLVKENSVLIALAGQGKTRGTVAINRIPLTTNQSIAAMTFNEEMYPYFVFSNLDNRYEELRKISSGDGARGGLNKQLVGNVIIPFPSFDEQKAIGDFFMDLNTLITLHQRKLSKLQQIKQAILSKLFV